MEITAPVHLISVVKPGMRSTLAFFSPYFNSTTAVVVSMGSDAQVLSETEKIIPISSFPSHFGLHPDMINHLMVSGLIECHSAGKVA